MDVSGVVVGVRLVTMEGFVGFRVLVAFVGLLVVGFGVVVVVVVVVVVGGLVTSKNIRNYLLFNFTIFY